MRLPVCALAAAGILLGDPTVANAEAGRGESTRTQALAFVRVIADVRIDLGGVREPIERRGVELATGSGFVATPSGLVLTSAHVVAETEPEDLGHVPEGASVRLENRRIEVVLGQGGERRAFDAWVAAADTELDLAALQVTAADLSYLPLGDSDATEPGRPVQVLGFPFGRQVEVARGGDAMPGVTITAGSLSAAREGGNGDRRYLQTDASVNPGSSGGPMLDEDGYVVGIVRMKLSRGATAPGAGFAVTVNVAKDFLEANGLLSQLPVGRLRPGVVQSYDWKGVRLEAPDGYTDSAAARVRLDLGEIEGIDARVYRLATSLPAEAFATALLQDGEVPGFAPAPAEARAGGAVLRRAGAELFLSSARGETAEGHAFRVEYAVLAWKTEKVVARYLGSPDAIAFNLSLIRRSLQSLDGERLRGGVPPQPLARTWGLPGTRGFSPAGFRSGEDAPIAVPPDWVVESAEDPGWRTCLGARGDGIVARFRGDFAVLARAWRLGVGETPARAALSGCAPEASFRQLGIDYRVERTVMARGGGALELEVEGPAASWPALEGALERWAAEIARSASR